MEFSILCSSKVHGGKQAALIYKLVCLTFFSEQEKVFTEVCSIITEASECQGKPKNLPGIPTLEDFSKIVELHKLLEPIASATNVLQGSGITSSRVIYEIKSVFDGTIVAACLCKKINFLKCIIITLQVLRTLQ